MNRQIILILAFLTLVIIQNIKTETTGSETYCDEPPPEPCRAKLIYDMRTFEVESVFSMATTRGLDCRVTASSRIVVVYNRSNNHSGGESSCSSTSPSMMIQVKPRRRLDPEFILDQRLNLADITEKFIPTNQSEITLQLVNIKKIGIDLGIDVESKHINYQLILVNVHFKFYTPGGRLIKSCADLNNHSLIRSVFQLPNYSNGMSLSIFKCTFPTPTCPWMFKNTRVDQLYMNGLTNTFYKRNTLRFTNESNDYTSLNATILNINLYKTDNIDLDLNLLNPHVFKSLLAIFVYDSVSRIRNDLLMHFPDLAFVYMKATFFRRINHRQGIEWIRARNSPHHRVINYNNPVDVRTNARLIFRLNLIFDQGEDVRERFPDADFCLYREFPFQQLVYLTLQIRNGTNKWNSISVFDIEASYWEKRTCTLEYVTRNFFGLNQLLLPIGLSRYNYSEIFDQKNRICDHEARVKLCDKAEYYFNGKQVILDRFFWSLFNKYTRTASNILLFLFSFFGIVTNFLVVFIIRKKDNNDLFKDFKQYNYLCSISAFNMAILTIQLFSWMSDCKNTVDFLCPETRRIIAIQFFKVIFKEAGIPALRFMSNFAYVAFAFNRISLIGKDHPKLVEFFTKTNFKRFMIVTSLISIALSVVKCFRYRVNYDHANFEYPFATDNDLWISVMTWQRGVYYLVTVVCDFLNYFVFVLVNLTIDVYMLVRLRKTLGEKLKRLDSMRVDLVGANRGLNERKQSCDSKLEMNNCKNNAIRMVVINSSLNFVFKLALVIMPLFNSIAFFQFDNFYENGVLHSFQVFYLRLNETDSINAISDLADLFYTILIACQLFIYRKFDTKIRIGFEKLTIRN